MNLGIFFLQLLGVVFSTSLAITAVIGVIGTYKYGMRSMVPDAWHVNVGNVVIFTLFSSLAIWQAFAYGWINVTP